MSRRWWLLPCHCFLGAWRCAHIMLWFLINIVKCLWLFCSSYVFCSFKQPHWSCDFNVVRGKKPTFFFVLSHMVILFAADDESRWSKCFVTFDKYITSTISGTRDLKALFPSEIKSGYCSHKPFLFLRLPSRSHSCSDYPVCSVWN